MNLTEEQSAAINYSGNMVLSACPGSGKTTVVVKKIVMALKHCQNYQGVIAISYTNKSSDELIRRCRKDIADIKSSFFGTIDKFYISEIIIPFLPHLWGKCSVDLSVIKYNDLSVDLKLVANHLLDDRFIDDIIDNDDVSLMKELYYQGVLILELIPLLSLYILNKTVSSIRYLKARYKSIFIDEYQDAGYLQHRIFLLISKSGVTATAVGDADQSIYGYSGRSEKYLIDLAKDQNFKLFSINLNHRCHPSIINYANRLMNHDCKLIDSDTINVFRTTISGTQADISIWARDEIKLILEKSLTEYPKDIAVLVRSNNSAEIVSNNIGMPHRVYLDDRLSKMDGKIPFLLKKLMMFKYSKNCTAQKIIDEFCNVNTKKVDIKKLRKIIRSIRNTNDCYLSSILNDISMILFSKSLEQEHIDAINEIISVQSAKNNYLPIDDSEIQIMTLHKSKGLEFDIVFHLDLYDWILPSREFIKDCYDEVFTDEKQCLNLHYVGITRARKYIIMVTSTRRLNSLNELKNAKPSQFMFRDGLNGLFSVINP